MQVATRPGGKGAGLGRAYPTETLLAELERITRELGRIPRRIEVLKMSSISPTTFERRFGGWLYDIPALLGKADPRNWDPDAVPPEIGGWLAGFFCGEGYFQLRMEHSSRSTLAIALKLTVRDDDAELLHFVRDTLQLEQPVRIFSNARRRAKGEQCGDEAKFNIYDIEVIYHKILPLFRKYPLRGKKQREFEVFAQGVEILHHKVVQGRRRYPYSPEERTALLALVDEMKRVRAHPRFGSSKANRTA